MNAIHHVSLSVLDLPRSAAWYRQVFPLTQVIHEEGETREALVFRFAGSRLMLGLVHHRDSNTNRFTPRNTGLDHVAFNVESREDLERWVQRLNKLTIENSGLIDLPIGAIVNFTDPDGIQLALFWERAVNGNDQIDASS